ncbi:MAG: hypothetical protein HND47_03960 [Chloroflexi bacterium]|nr:hypothetical protein [Chloroflexota bacterium]
MIHVGDDAEVADMVGHCGREYNAFSNAKCAKQPMKNSPFVLLQIIGVGVQFSGVHPREEADMKNQSQKKSLYLTFYIIGVISGLALTALSTWADLEAAYYGFSRRASARLNGFSLPDPDDGE